MEKKTLDDSLFSFSDKIKNIHSDEINQKGKIKKNKVINKNELNEQYDNNDNDNDNDNDNYEYENINTNNQNKIINENNTIIKLLEKSVINFIYEKVLTKSLSDNNDLDKDIMDIIKEKGYSNVESCLNNYIKNNIISKNYNEKGKEGKKSKKTNKDNNNSLNNRIKKEKLDEKENNKNPDEYHYYLINKFYHRYKCINIIKNVQQYSCCVEECNGFAELNVEEKKFCEIHKHSISDKRHPNFNDDKPVKFMKKRNLKHLHIKKNNNNEKYHMEWFN